MTPDLTHYTFEYCPNREDLKESLARLGCGYRELKLSTPEGISVEGTL